MITIADIEKEAGKVNTTPTKPQKEAGNYSMGHISVKGMKIAIENPKGSRRYYGDDGDYVIMSNHYGYFNVTKGKDGDAVDVFLGPDIEDFDTVYCIDQNNEDGEFDETKVMLGFKSKEEAKEAYLRNYDSDWKGFRDITAVSLKVFKRWLYRGRKQRQPFADYVYIKKKKLNETKEMENYKQINLDNVTEPVFDYELFDNGNANYYFTTEEPLPNNAATLEEFFEYYVEQTTQKIKWDFDWSYGGGQAFGTRDDGMEIQVDAGGNGDFTSHIITVTVQQNSQLNEKNMKKVVNLSENDIMSIINKSVKLVLNEGVDEWGDDAADMMGMYDGQDGPTNDPESFDEIVYYKAREIMRKFGFEGTDGFVKDKKVDALEYVMDTYMDYYANDEKIREMDADDVAKLMAREAMKIIDLEYYECEVAPFFEEPQVNENRVIKLSESDIRMMIKNTVKRVIMENKLTRDDDFSYPDSSDDADLDLKYNEWKSANPSKEDMDELYGGMPENDEPYLHGLDEGGYSLDADDEGDGSTKEYMAGVRYARNLIAKSRVPNGLLEQLDELDSKGIISPFQLGMLDTLDEEL